MNRLSVLALPLLVPVALAAQSPQAVARAAATITEADVRRRVHLLADDSMKGRDTPSPELEMAARYIAAEFQRFGLKAGGDSGTFIQRYGVTRKQLDTATSTLTVSGPAAATLRLGPDVNVLPFVAVSGSELSGPVVVLSGPADSANPFGGQDIKGAWIVMPATAGGPAAGLSADFPTLQAAVTGGGARGVVLVSNRTDSLWQAATRRIARPAMIMDGAAASQFDIALLEIRDATAQRVFGLDAAALRTATVRTGRRLDGVTLTFKPTMNVLSRVNAPNVVGILEGSDPQLKNEYVVYSAHMDHVGVTAGGRCQARGADSICNGADDDASGTVAVIEAAEAFASLQPRPKRSLVFLTVSGEERGLWGSGYFADHPPVPVGQIVANVNIDMIGRNWKDTIVVIGKEHSDLGATLNRVGAAHPELNMQPINDIWPQENFYFRSDHYNFARKGVPILFFFSGTHPDYHQVSDHPDKIDAEKEARIVKLVFYLGLEVANAAQKPQWNPESYKQIVQQATN